MTDIVSFGIPELDKLLGGGLTIGSTNYLEVERGTQELSFVGAFLNEGLRRKDFCGVTLYDLPPEILIDRLTELGINMRKALDSGSFIIADLYEEGEYDPEHRGPILKTNNLNDPNALLRLYLDMAEEGKKRVQSGRFNGLRLVAYSASTVVMNNKPEAAYRLAKLARMQVRQNRVTNLSLFNTKMFDEKTVAALEESCDSIIALSIKEVKGKYQRFIRVKQSPLHTFWMDEIPYDIVDGRPSIKAE
jgi:KaiC/GvpD/RAD55 family RecA-like ATPase